MARKRLIIHLLLLWPSCLPLCSLIPSLLPLLAAEGAFSGFPCGLQTGAALGTLQVVDAKLGFLRCQPLRLSKVRLSTSPVRNNQYGIVPTTKHQVPRAEQLQGSHPLRIQMAVVDIS